ncbi:MAG: nuclear transport factor 2 family protein [Acidimicrobiales bacterium]
MTKQAHLGPDPLVPDEAPIATSRPADLVRRLLDADAHHDLTAYRALLADEFTERTEGEVTSGRGDDAAYVAARSWALAPSAHRRVDDINEAPGCVTVRYRLDHAVPPGIAARERPGNFLGYSIYETREGHIIRAAHFFSEQRETDIAPAVTAHASAAVLDDVAARRRTRRNRLIGGLTVLLSLLVAEPVWAAPVVATTAWQGGGLAFASLVPVYFALGYVASLVVIRRAKGSASGWFERWLSGGADRHYLRGVRRLVRAGTVIGFVLSSMLFGAIVTTWLLLQLDRSRHIRRDAAVSSLIFSVGFVGFYAGIASLIF